MTRYFLTRLTLEGFRGINNEGSPLDIRFKSDSVNSVFAVNGNSAGNRTVSSPSGHSDPEGFLFSLRESFALLDYRTLYGFIEDSPLERGRTFSALLGLSAYSDRRQALQAVSDTRALNSDLDIRVLKNDIKSVQQSVTQAIAGIRSNYEKVTVNPVEDIEKLDIYADDVANAIASVELLRTHVAGKKLHEIDFDNLKTVIKTAEGGNKRRELQQIIQDIGKLEALTVYDFSAIQDEQDKLKTLIDERDTLLASTRGDLFKRLYESAQTIIANGVWTEDNQCPLCDSNLTLSISSHIESQLTQYKDAVAKAEEINDFWLASSWKRCLSVHEDAKLLAIDPQDRKLSGLNRNVSSGDIAKDDLPEVIRWTAELAAKVPDVLKTINDNKEKIEAEFPASLVQLTEHVEYARQFREALEQYRGKQGKESALQKRLDVRERWQGFITNAAALFSEAEASLLKDRIADIDAEYKSMFKDIMKVCDIVPDLKGRREDLHVQLSDFHGQHQLSARALLPESYRNALAISVFLAAAKNHTGVPRFIVLDDVTSSFDAGHQYFLLELTIHRS